MNRAELDKKYDQLRKGVLSVQVELGEEEVTRTCALLALDLLQDLHLTLKVIGDKLHV